MILKSLIVLLFFIYVIKKKLSSVKVVINKSKNSKVYITKLFIHLKW